MNERAYWVWLTMVFGVSNRKIWQIIQLCLTPDSAYRMLRADSSGLNLTENEQQNIRHIDISAAEALIKNAENLGINVVCIEEDSYPWILKTIYEPPAVLYYKGNIRCMDNRRTATVVGTRNVSSYGIRAVQHICTGLADKGVVIISGFALGTDIAAHMSAASRGQPTVCVLGCGIDKNYPKENSVFRERILDSGGLFLSEYPPGTPPFPAHFPVRNRILAALGMCTLVFEASAKSGSLITANIAANTGRPVLVLPPADIMSSSYSGNAGLLRDGAIPLIDVQDVLEAYFQIDGMDTVKLWTEGLDITRFANKKITKDESPLSADLKLIQENSSASRSRKKSREKSAEKEKRAEMAFDIVTKKTKKAKSSVQETKPERSTSPDSLKQRFPDMTDEQFGILSAIGGDTLHADTIADKLGCGIEELMSALTDMEIEGMVVSLPGNYYEIP